jgi:hypothetical protein
MTLNVFIPAGSIDPATMRSRGLPYGGTGFKGRGLGSGSDEARLSYRVKFPLDFMPGRGGKLPGLCGGRCNGGGNIPNGYDGFSARFMWDSNTRGKLYVYKPDSVNYGTSIGAGALRFVKGQWARIDQEIKLNTVGQADRRIRVWLDGQLVIGAEGLEFRYTNDLKIDGIYFDVFYGGSDDSWAAPQDTSIQFADFSVAVR